MGARKILHASRRKHILIVSVSFILEGCFWVVLKCLDLFALNWSCHPYSVAAAPAQSQLKPEAELSLAKAQPELLSDGSYISANSGSG